MGDRVNFPNFPNFWRVREVGMFACAAAGRLPTYRLTIARLTNHDSRLTTGAPVIDHQQGTSNPLDQLREAHGVFLDVLSNVRPEQMTLPTPDDDWDVRALINHVVQ
jgi:hypothetical protein